MSSSDTKNQLSEILFLKNKGYSFRETVGQGNFGKVKFTYYKDPKSEVVEKLACKVIDKTNTKLKYYLDKFYPREIKIIQKLNHPFIVGIHSIFESKTSTFIFMT